MSKPDIVPKQTVSGIAVDPRTLERVIPESKRPDGTVRKQLKVRPGFTPQEDISRFRGSRQQQQERNALPKGHILGWVAPSAENKSQNAAGKSSGATSAGNLDGDKPGTKSAAKNAKRKAKKQAEKQKIIQANWEDSDEEGAPTIDSAKNDRTNTDRADLHSEADGEVAKERVATSSGAGEEERLNSALAEELEKLDVR